MVRKTIGPMLLAAAPLLSTPALAAPIELTPAQWAAMTAGLPAIVEDFESFSGGPHPSPMTLANGTYTANAPFVVSDLGFCDATPDQCLTEASVIQLPRTFSAFPTGTTFWGGFLTMALNNTDTFQMTVVGNSGVSVFTHPIAFTGVFVSFHDPTGLLSVTFQNLGSNGFTNYSLDDVTTASTVPEPATLLLLGSGLAAAAGVRRRRR